MRYLLNILFSVILLPQASADELALEQYWELAGFDNLQPSGLSFCGNDLVMVSDRHNHRIFTIPLLNAPSTQIKTYRQMNLLNALPDDSRWQEQLADWGLKWTDKRFDWEGVHCDSHYSLFLASESLSAVAKIDLKGNANWVTPGLFSEIQQQGFATRLNTGFEGITVHSDDITIALEREPRGLLRVKGEVPLTIIDKLKVIKNEGVISPLNADFTGLWLEHGPNDQPPKLYTLERNFFRVCRRNYEHWGAEACWSYHATERSPEFRFENSHYGLAEGIARLGNSIYIILDNNGEPRLKSGKNAPLLFKFKRPDNW
ncbi:esterase-like activity of phytase family protein [Alkalimarinus coralli]|uniref:esterase-like activity of phytase family protein n=1 Tax=Alkalimarinus coralli TaxID=2935863 RepID=UPI00202B98DB|nr:esterase-like activity of phytase family protein [Alkalimarinus coralli]